MRLTRDEVRELLPAYAVGALDAAEMQAVETALRLYPELIRELHAFTDVTARMASVGTLTPPPEVRERFLESVAREAGASRVTPQARVVEREHSRVYTGTTASTTASPLRKAAAPVLLGIALAASLLLLVQSRRVVATQRAQLDSQEQALAASDARIAQQDTLLSTLLGGEQSLLVVNMQAPAQTGPGVRFFWNVATRRGLLHAFRLPPAAAGRAYQLWLIRDGKPVPSRVFNSDADGRGLVADIELPASLDGVSAVAITEEPEAGSTAPTTQPFLVGAVRRTD